MRSRRILTLGPDSDPLWVCIYVQPIGDRWAAMSTADNVTLPAPGGLKGLGFFGETAEEAEQVTKKYLGMTELMNRIPPSLLRPMMQ